MKSTVVALLALALSLAAAGPLAAHCQVPCGIYGDSLRFLTLDEHVATLDKSVKMISELAGKGGAADVNQMVRWVENKEQYADEVAAIATDYFLKQRIKAPTGADAAARERYLRQLEILHQILVSSMKIKQTVDPAEVSRLGALVGDLAAAYLPEQELEHFTAHRQHPAK